VRKIGSTFYLTLHEEAGSPVQRTILYSSANGYSGWTDAGNILPDADSGEMSVDHDGYFRWHRNHVFTGLPYKYIGASLASRGSTVGTEDGTFFNSAIYGSNDPSVGWTRLRFEGMGQQPGFDGLTNTYRLLRIESAQSGFKRANDGNIVGLACIVQAASGATARVSLLSEVVYDRFARFASVPTQLLARTGDHANEQGQPEVVTFNGTQYVLFQGATGANVNSIQISTLTFDAAATAPDAYPIRNTIKTTDFRTLLALPSDMAKFSTSSVSFSSTTGITLSSASAANALLKLGPAFTPSNYDCVEIMFYGLTCALSGDVCNFGFMTGDETQDQFSDATEYIQAYTAGNGGVKVGERAPAGTTLYSTPTTSTGHGFGNQTNSGGDMRKQIGLRWYPQRSTTGSFTLLGEDGIELYRVVTPARTPTIATARMPAIAFNSSSGVKSIAFQQVSIRYLSVDGSRETYTINTVPRLGSRFLRIA
jgi:hypothetical protein